MELSIEKLPDGLHPVSLEGNLGEAFVLDDDSFGGLCLVKDIAKVYREHVVTTEVLAASLRGVRDVGRAFEYGADIVTMPPSVFEGMYNHVLTDKGLDQFDKDYAASIAE